MLDPRAIATLGIGYGAELTARIGIWSVTPPVIARHGVGGYVKARRKRPLHTPARADTRFEICCAVAAEAHLALSSAAIVAAQSGIESTAGLQLAAGAAVAQQAAIESSADVYDVLLEILTMA